MTGPLTIDQLPGPHGVPILGNLLDLDTPNPMETIIGWGLQWGPIFRVSVPGRDLVIVSGADLVEEICDDTRFGKQLGPGLKAAQDDGSQPGAVHQRDERPAVAPRAQHPDGAVQSAGRARVHATHGRHRRATGGQVVPPQPG